MGSKYYNYPNTGVCVLELSGSLRYSHQDELNQLEKTLSEMGIQSRLLIHQTDKDLEIDSTGFKKLLSKLAFLDNEHKAKIAFSNVTGKFETYLEQSKLDQRYKKYSSIEEAIGALND
jgi:hypothetical protein